MGLWFEFYDNYNFRMAVSKWSSGPSGHAEEVLTDFPQMCRTNYLAVLLYGCETKQIPSEILEVREIWTGIFGEVGL